MHDPDAQRAVAALVYAYAERIDAGDLDGVADLLSDAVWRSASHPGGVRGRDAIRARYADVILYDGVPATQHVVTNLVIDVQGDTAVARSRYTVFQARPGLPLQAIVAGRYEDDFVHGPGGWRFAGRTIHVDLVGDLSHHLRGRIASTDR